MRYVDDANFVGEVIEPGIRYENNRLTLKRQYVDEDQNVPDDVRTAKVIQTIANSISKFIQVEIDCPSMHSNNLLPILDLEVEMVDNMVLYRFYRKEMANFKVIMAKSAMPYNMKKTCLIQEVIRILRNTSRRLEDSVKTQFLTEFSLRLKESGYAEKVRFEIIKRGVEGFEKQVEKDENGVCPLYRPKGYEKEQRRKKKMRVKSSWYKPYDTVLFCPPTPKSELAEQLREITEKQKKEGGTCIKVVEKSGIKIRNLLPGLKENNECSRENCFIHSSGGRGNCNKEGVVYKGTCLLCEREGKESIYIGESCRSGYVRGLQHLHAIRNYELDRHKNNAFSKHIRDTHNGEETPFKLDVIKSYKKPLERQVREGVEIVRSKANMNSKLDHFHPGIRRVVFEDLYED